MTDTASDDLRRARRFQESLARRLSPVVHGAGWATGLFNPELPDVWNLNYVVLDDPGPAETSSGVAEVTDRLMGKAGCRHRRVTVEDEAVGARLADGFRELGWQVHRFCEMALRRPPDRPSPHPARRLELDTYIEAKRAFMEREPEGKRPDVVRQLVEHIRLAHRSIDHRLFGAGGSLESLCEMFVEDGVAQIEDVGTLSEQRGRGLARAVVLEAIDSARATGCDLVFLVADADDWPKALYEKLGFEEIGVSYAFLLTNSQ